jgi:hypothetical protein
MSKPVAAAISPSRIGRRATSNAVKTRSPFSTEPTKRAEGWNCRFASSAAATRFGGFDLGSRRARFIGVLTGVKACAYPYYDVVFNIKMQ